MVHHDKHRDGFMRLVMGVLHFALISGILMYVSVAFAVPSLTVKDLTLGSVFYGVYLLIPGIIYSLTMEHQWQFKRTIFDSLMLGGLLGGLLCTIAMFMMYLTFNAFNDEIYLFAPRLIWLNVAGAFTGWITAVVTRNFYYRYNPRVTFFRDNFSPCFLCIILAALLFYVVIVGMLTLEMIMISHPKEWSFIMAKNALFSWVPAIIYILVLEKQMRLHKYRQSIILFGFLWGGATATAILLTEKLFMIILQDISAFTVLRFLLPYIVGCSAGMITALLLRYHYNHKSRYRA